jgi:hypothetical protein
MRKSPQIDPENISRHEDQDRLYRKLFSSRSVLPPDVYCHIDGKNQDQGEEHCVDDRAKGLTDVDQLDSMDLKSNRICFGQHLQTGYVV